VHAFNQRWSKAEGRRIRWMLPEFQSPAARQSLSNQELLTPVNKRSEAFFPVVAAMAPVFKKRTGDKLVVVQDTAAGVVKRIRDGQDFDLAILPPAMLEALGKADAVSVGSIIPLAKVVAGTQNGTVYAGAVSAWASDSPPALSLLILLASEDTQLVLKDMLVGQD
jgi:hypothetical protein